MKLLKGVPDRRKACRVKLNNGVILEKAYLQERRPINNLRWHYISGSYYPHFKDEWEYLEAKEKGSE